MDGGCDFSPLKDEIQGRLKAITIAVEGLMGALDFQQICLLNEFQQVKNMLVETKSLASTFYLNCYLSPFTNKHEELSTSIANLSQRNHGALIVIQRSDPVEPYMTAGVMVGATVTHSLIESIFIPGSPLHDGAVFIQQDKIVTAGNILPVSRASAGEKKLGTRHRAGLGLTEHCDALVIIVSEETGQASFALNGKLYPFSAEV